MSAAEAAFTRFKSRQAITWAHVNLTRIDDGASIMSIGQPYAGRRVFVVGAGPSLAKNIEQLRGAHPVIAVNASAAALERAGITPDLVVCRESLDLVDQIEATSAPAIALDIASHPATWDAAAGRPDGRPSRLAWFIPAYPRHFHVLGLLGVRGVFGGTAALTSAVAIAMHLGAASIVLVGCDFACAPDGAAYHPDAPRGELRGSMIGDEALEFTGDDANVDRCVRSGQKPPPLKVRAQKHTAFDFSGELATVDVWDHQREWLTTQAERHGRRVELLNATEGGVGVVGWRNVKLADAVAPPRIVAHGVVARADEKTREALRDLANGGVFVLGDDDDVQVIEQNRAELDLSQRVPAERVRATLTILAKQAAIMEQAAREMLSSKGPDLRVLTWMPGLYDGAAFTEPLAAHRLIDLPRGPSLKRLVGTYEAFRDVAVEAQKILGGGRVK